MVASTSHERHTTRLRHWRLTEETGRPPTLCRPTCHFKKTSGPGQRVSAAHDQPVPLAATEPKRSDRWRGLPVPDRARARDRSASRDGGRRTGTKPTRRPSEMEIPCRPSTTLAISFVGPLGRSGPVVVDDPAPLRPPKRWPARRRSSLFCRLGRHRGKGIIPGPGDGQTEPRPALIPRRECVFQISSCGGGGGSTPDECSKPPRRPASGRPDSAVQMPDAPGRAGRGAKSARLVPAGRGDPGTPSPHRQTEAAGLPRSLRRSVTHHDRDHMTCWSEQALRARSLSGRLPAGVQGQPGSAKFHPTRRRVMSPMAVFLNRAPTTGGKPNDELHLPDLHPGHA